MHGCGSHFDPSASFLKCVLRTNVRKRYVGSVTMVSMISHCSPFGSFTTSKCSSIVALAL